ncbi:flagellar basal body-associated protein FliL [Halomonas sp. ML-15]|uniref:flagellar basal body-associated protein FliL n=1 Tax=Halomonas sp. ML-15 TaxID=2773305 RepID=UPI00174679A5|nr:flagellar basal body-associated protein FliL [Halomonas sp. ML-15]MBD3895223.1 flagellar basal body-associated protein FliL [Halomonas sp. ML-15]
MAKNSSAGSRKPWWIIGLLIILFSMGSSAAMYFMMDNRDDPAPESAQTAVEDSRAPAPIFVDINPFTVNLQSRHYDQRLLYVGLSLRVGNETTRELIEEHMPQVRSRLLMLLSSQQAEELTSPEGKQQLSAEILALFDQPLTDPQPSLMVNDVLYTEFIVQ